MTRALGGIHGSVGERFWVRFQGDDPAGDWAVLDHEHRLFSAASKRDCWRWIVAQPKGRP